MSHVKICEAPIAPEVEGRQSSGKQPLPPSCVVRLYEPYGGRGSVQFCSAMPLESAATCNLLEQDIGRCNVERDPRTGVCSFSLVFKPFEIVSVKLTFTK